MRIANQMNYYRLIPDYKRDVYFQYDAERNPSDRFEFEKSAPSASKVPTTQYYTVDKKDSYLEEYDFLPCIGPPLVSKAVKLFLQESASDSIKFYPAEIKFIDTGECLTTFFVLVVTKVISCLDEQKSVIKPLLPSRPSGPKKIESIYLDKAKAGDSFIFKIKNHENITMVSKSFVDEWNKLKLRGLLFAKEGSQINPEFE